MLKNGLKRLVAAVSAGAVILTSTAFVLAADDSYVYYDENFNEFPNGTIVDLHTGANINESYDGYKFECGTRNGDEGTIYISAKDGVINLGVTKNASTSRTPKIHLTKTTGKSAENDLVMKLKVNFSSAAENNPIVIKDSESKSISYYAKSESWVNQWVELTVVTPQSENSMVIASKDGAVLDYQKLDLRLNDISMITMKDEVNYIYSIDDLYIADETYVMPDELAAEAAASTIDIDAGQISVKKAANGTYTFNGSFNLPELSDENAQLTWGVLQKAKNNEKAEWTTSELIAIEGNVATPVYSEGYENYDLKLVANVDYNGKKAVKEFNVVIEEPIEGLYYDEDFSSITTGKLVNLQPDGNKNTKYGGLEFSCGTRPAGDYDKIYIEATKDGALDFVVLNYADSSRTPKLTLTYCNTVSFEKNVLFRAKVKFSDTEEDHPIVIKDKNSTEISYHITDESLKDQWLDLVIVSDKSKSALLVYNSATKEAVDYQENAAIANVAEITMKDGVTYSYSLDSIFIADQNYSIEDKDIAAVAKYKLDIDDTQYVVTKTDEGYTIIGNFTLPESDVHKDVKIAWNALQRLKAGSETKEETENVELLADESEETQETDETQGTEEEESSDGWTATEFVKISDGKVTIAPTDDISNYDVKIVADITYGSASIQRDYPLEIKLPQQVVDEQITNVSLTTKSGREVAEGAQVTGDLVFYKGDSVVPVTWQCYKPVEKTTTDSTGAEVTETVYEAVNIITPDGVFMPTDYSGDLRLIATASYQGATAQSVYNVKVSDAITTYIDPAIESLKAKSADTADKDYAEYDIDMTKEIGTINYDLKLPLSIPVSDGKVVVSWKALTDNITITEDGIAQYMTSDFNEHPAEIEATFSYVKNSTELASKTPDSYKYTVLFTKEDSEKESIPGKYKVRFDAAYEDNFASIPSYAVSDMTLPSKGYFGSTISWSSSAPGVISSSGKFTQPVTTTNVVLTATVTAPYTAETGSFTKTVTVYGTGSSSSSGGGRSSSGSGSSRVTGSIVASNSTTKAPISTGADNGTSVAGNNGEQVSEPAVEGFADLGSVPWAEEAIKGLADKGVISGRSATEFAPNDNVTRAEFAKILVGAFGIEAGGDADFSDVSESDWFYPYVAAAYGMGIIGGYDDGRFGSNDLITRQDMAVMVKRAVDATGKTLEEVNAAITFDDDSQIADYAKEAVSALQKAGIINGTSDTTFSPVDNATRAQAAKILYSFAD